MSSGAYDPKTFESGIYAAWTAGGYFHAEADATRPPFTIVIPPPNVTGALHLGHALNNTLQDMLIRRKRMQGFNACWLPGTDHAGIATQAVVEKRLREEQGLSRHELGREGLVQKIWEWKEDYNARILNQLRRMGCSCDWDRTRFTLDDQCAKAVYETFFRFFRDGLIYRGLRLVNWDPALQTAVADDEIEHKTVKTNLWHIRYPILPKDARDALGESLISGAIARATSANAQLGRDYLIVATTRPETMLADTAVAVHPEDERYQALVGQSVLLPLMCRAIPVVADGMLVKREFGTGCVKVTPGHDPNDYACWQRKQGQADEFGIIDLLTPDGRINEKGRADSLGGPVSDRSSSSEDPAHRKDRSETGPPARGAHPGDHPALGAQPGDGPSSAAPVTSGGAFDYSGMKKEDARKKVVADLETLGLLEKIEPYETEIGHSDRSKAAIEPLRSEQWFVRMDASNGPKLAESAMEAVRDGRVKFFPERYAKTYLDWLGEKRDWCISRQLWWGHRIPVWTVTLRSDARLTVYDQRLEFQSQRAQLTQLLARIGDFAIQRDVDRESNVYVCPLGQTECIAIAEMAASNPYPTWAVPSPGVHPPFNPPIGFDHPLREVNADLWHLVENVGAQDPDVLDTWFSSALWPHSTFGWPESGPSRDREGAGTDKTGAARAQSPLPHGRGSDQSSDLDYFYPTSVLSTAREIITLWVARMVMTGLYNTGRELGDGRRVEGRVPFQHVYIHAVIQDGQGRRMSKSAGNGVDPLDIIDAYGADALRFTLAQLATETQDIRIPVKPMQLPDGRTVNTSERFELGRNLVTKLWQAATGFVIPTCRDMRIELKPDRQGGAGGSQSGRNPGSAEPSRGREGAGADKTGAARTSSPLPDGRGSDQMQHTAHRPSEMPLFEKWIRVKLLACIREIDRRIDYYEFAAAVDAVRTFFWNDLCDWYIEEVKSHLRDADTDDAEKNDVKITLLQVFDIVLSLFHPAMPYVTEAIWAEIGREIPKHYELIWPGDRPLPDKAPMLIVAPWPKSCGTGSEGADNPCGTGSQSLKGSCGTGFQPVSSDAAWLSEVAAQTDAEREVDAFLAVIRAVREIRTSLNAIRSQVKQPALRNLPSAVIRCDATTAATLRGGSATIARLGQVEKEGLAIGSENAKPPQSMTRVLSVAGTPADGRATTQTIEVFVSIAGLADLDIERKRLSKELEEKTSAASRLEGKLANEGFVAKAKAEVVEAERARLTELRETIATLQRNLAELD